MNGTLYTWFRRTARRHADTIALEVGAAKLSYAELLELAERLAAKLTAITCGRPPAIALYASRNVAAYVGYLAALRAGAVVVPLAAAAPTMRNHDICRMAGTTLVIADDTSCARAADLPGTLIHLSEDLGWRDSLPPASSGLPYPGRAGDVAYILFTSGSTGRPKGVPIRHRQLAQFLPYCIKRFEVDLGSRFSQTFDLTFDPSVFDMFLAWTGGGTVVVPQPDELLTPTRFVAERGITHWFSVPSVISVARRIHSLPPASMPWLRWSLFAGEQLTIEAARAWAVAAPFSVVENVYGPTELTVSCTMFRLRGDPSGWPSTPNGTVPIGRPFPHLEALILGGDGRPAGEGELCVRGSQRFSGYLDPRDNEGRFLRDHDGLARPVSGGPAPRDWYRTGDLVRWLGSDLLHLGRLDDQIKIHGYRVEPGEVEYVLRQHPGVDDAVVLAVDAGGGARLCALFCGKAAAGTSIADHVRRRLPSYMVPERLLWVREFPVNANGKTDRRRLRQFVLDGCAAVDARR